ncbi:SCO2322 family protein [Streptacidiphilus jiangxiensis]|uniref:MYXO-CTERM domain-containing protein n=1 Tax=Streptacidiphilus jiangxiensis TaxID=235985 RepID=A0A1H7VYW1_STRJI|nr:SCO2322 family protein [Streptacidiphilus jiangxiensis]SEM13967.1 hypothetical protein SAMN05414137_11971 [Streptacidiphilus jiangxiensis]
MRRLVAAAVAVVTVFAAALLALPLLTAAPASATAYRYWAFWSWTQGAWSYQQQGPNTNVPADGSVDGWRFGVGEDSAHALSPRPTVAPSFAQLCAGTPAVSGKKRVAVVIDAGTDRGAPAERGACAVLDPGATSAQLLAELVPPLRYDVNGMLCAISGYPVQGCGEAVADPAATSPATSAPTAAAKSGDSSVPALGWAAGGALVVLLGGAAWWQNRRRRHGG